MCIPSAGEKKLASLAHGCDLLRTSTVWFCLELLTAGALFWSMKLFWVYSADPSGCVLSALLVHSVSGAACISHCNSTQVKLPWHVALFFLWWVPPLNLFLMGHVYRTAKRELQLECAKAECNVMRKESDCKTRYPILLVHGIFFRDWQFFNYWDGFRTYLKRSNYFLRKTAVGTIDFRQCQGTGSTNSVCYC